MEKADAKDKIRVLAWSPNISTRFLVNVSLDPVGCELELADSAAGMIAAVKENSHAVYLIDATREATGAPGTGDCFRDVAALALRHMIRVVAIADKAPDADTVKMADFGPLAVIAFNFSRTRLNRAVQTLNDMQAKWQPARDSGSRVKSDPKFYKVNRFTE